MMQKLILLVLLLAFFGWSGAAQTVIGPPAASIPAVGGTGLPTTFYSLDPVCPCTIPNAEALAAATLPKAAFTTLSPLFPPNSYGMSPLSLESFVGSDGTNFSSDYPSTDNSYFVMTGYLKIRSPGTVNFSLYGDDGAQLTVGHQILISGTSGGGGLGSAAATFSQAGLYAITIEYFQDGGGLRLQLLADFSGGNNFLPISSVDLYGSVSPSSGPTELFQTALFNDPSLVSYWRFEGNSNDSKGRHTGADSSVTYGIPYGVFGQGVNFGGGSNIVFPDSSDFHLSAPYSISFWINPNITGYGTFGYNEFLSNTDSSGNHGFLFVNYSDYYYPGITPVYGLGFIYGAGPYGQNANTTLTGALTNGLWYHVALTDDGARVTMYINGIVAGSGPENPSSYAGVTGLQIGGVNGNSQKLNGSLDDVAIFSRALTVAEVSGLYTGNYSPTVLSVTPSALSFSYQQGATGTVPGKALSVTSSGAPEPMSASVVTGGSWLSITSASATTPGNVTVAVSPTMAAGNYSGSVQVAASGATNGPITVPVSLSVAQPAVTRGTIQVNANIANASFTITGPNLTLSGTTPPNIGTFTAFAGQPVGNYRIDWGIPLGPYIAPNSSSQPLPPGSTITFSGVFTPAPSSSFLLQFPLAGKDPYSAALVTVFDHSMKSSAGGFALYGGDAIVQAFSTEKSAAGKAPQSGTTCYPQAVPGPFMGNTSYVGDGDTRYLCYDGHPGLDFRTEGGTNTYVFAAAAGTVFYPVSIPGLISNSAPDYHILGIKPPNADYIIYYLHLTTYGDTHGAITPSATENIIPAIPGCPSTLPIQSGGINAGCVIGRAGGWGIVPGTNLVSSGAFPVHLHFEVHKIIDAASAPSAIAGVIGKFTCPAELQLPSTKACVPVDPYGWDGNPSDDLYPLPSVRLWDHSPVIQSVSPPSLTAGTSPVSVMLSVQGLTSDTLLRIKTASATGVPMTFSDVPVTGIVVMNGQTMSFSQAFANAGDYFLYVERTGGPRSNARKLTVTPRAGGSR